MEPVTLSVGVGVRRVEIGVLPAWVLVVGALDTQNRGTESGQIGRILGGPCFSRGPPCPFSLFCSTPQTPLSPHHPQRWTGRARGSRTETDTRKWLNNFKTHFLKIFSEKSSWGSLCDGHTVTMGQREHSRVGLPACGHRVCRITFCPASLPLC